MQHENNRKNAAIHKPLCIRTLHREPSKQPRLAHSKRRKQQSFGRRKAAFCSLVDGFPLADMPHFTTAKAMFLKEQAENAGHYFP